MPQPIYQRHRGRGRRSSSLGSGFDPDPDCIRCSPCSACHANGHCECFRRRDMLLDRLRDSQARVRSCGDELARDQVKRLLHRHQQKKKKKPAIDSIWDVLVNGCVNALGRVTGARDELDQENWRRECSEYRRGLRNSGRAEGEDEGLIAVGEPTRTMRPPPSQQQRQQSSNDPRVAEDDEWYRYHHPRAVPANIPPQRGLLQRSPRREEPSQPSRQRQQRERQQEQQQRPPSPRPGRPNLFSNPSGREGPLGGTERGRVRRGRNARRRAKSPRVLGTILETYQH
ncbi:hypothetical protein NLG97_g4463 [Lecanicillium saksenae]|uniref:Uncharacterized protein n=1 Tax=Lecanicillium saksenae TaxID=468837 RepID=A0ACC1QVT5_9HYPO|nr:hypothetical protein NLG97_g4463 [Lecanicillium saksenae]